MLCGVTKLRRKYDEIFQFIVTYFSTISGVHAKLKLCTNLKQPRCIKATWYLTWVFHLISFNVLIWIQSTMASIPYSPNIYPNTMPKWVDPHNPSHTSSLFKIMDSTDLTPEGFDLYSAVPTIQVSPGNQPLNQWDWISFYDHVTSLNLLTNHITGFYKQKNIGAAP